MSTGTPSYIDQEFVAFIEGDDRFGFRKEMGGRVVAVCVACGSQQFSRWGMANGDHMSSCEHWTDERSRRNEWWKP